MDRRAGGDHQGTRAYGAVSVRNTGQSCGAISLTGETINSRFPSSESSWRLPAGPLTMMPRRTEETVKVHPDCAPVMALQTVLDCQADGCNRVRSKIHNLSPDWHTFARLPFAKR